MKTIHKYSIAMYGYFSLDLPVDFKIIHVGCDPKGQPSMWCEVDTAKCFTMAEFCIVFTGEENLYDKHIGTFNSGELVIHLYKVTV